MADDLMGMTIDDLRWRRDLASRDGDIDLALACAIAIDRKKYRRPKRVRI